MTKPNSHTITAHGYQATISTLGAELKSLVDLRSGEAYMWSGDPSVWKGTAPILFPIVGRLKDGQYQYNGKTYHLDKHGFARNSFFELRINQADEKSFLLTSTPETLIQYPFEFELEVFFSIKSNGLNVRYEVRNTGNDLMLFTIGSHPAFSIPLNGESTANYFLEFEVDEQLDCYYIENDLLCEKPIVNFIDRQKKIPITPTLFDNDAIIFKNIQSRKVSIKHQKTGERVTIDLDCAPHLGLWAKPNSPFICIEPWFSYDDTATHNGQLSKKPGMLSLHNGEVFSTGYVVHMANNIVD